MTPLRVYLDTSVIGGAFDEEFAVDTKALIAAINSGRITPVVSDLVRAEVRRAPENVRQLLDGIEAQGAEVISLTETAERLASDYVTAGVVSENYLEDATHIALATIARVDVLVSWNFKHIVNLQRIRGFNGVNLLKGYQALEIRSPREVVAYGDS